ncbi:nucleotidyltransferase domain-containing protein [Candidatus Kuenenia sp.]|uniref:nucleotidyltransferase domain-containing protein n=1 Tax=Candidatus Kuenenia sp. TaxID=2499824 RepID=UPI00321F9138
MNSEKKTKSLLHFSTVHMQRGTPHKRSDIDLAVFIRARDEKEEIEIIDKILMSTERQISILRLDNEDESPFVVQESLKGIHLVETDNEALCKVAHRVLREKDEIRFRRSLRNQR